MLKSNKGITLTSLIVTIIIILILTTIIVKDTYTGKDYKSYKLMCADVEMLEEKILIYYNKYGELPTSNLSQEDGGKIQENLDKDPEDMKRVDTSRLSGITLNYGDAEDVFVIDVETFEVYYLNGIEYDEEIYYTD